jgi:anti-sigma B factor antagonist
MTKHANMTTNEMPSASTANPFKREHLQAGAICNVEVLALQGRLDAAYVHNQKTMFDVLPGQAPTPLVVDLQDISFIDSTGLGFLVMLGKNAAAQGRRFALCNPSKQAQMLFELTRLHQVFDLFPTLALASAGMTVEVK